MKTYISVIIVILLYLQSSFAQVRSPLELTDIFDLEYVSDPQISPDGSRIVYVRNFKDIMTDQNHSNLWMVNFDGSDNKPLTTGNQSDTYPRWSHDGKKIIFKSDMDDEKTKLYLMWVDTRELLALTNTAEPPGAVAWSYDDQYLAFDMFVPERKEPVIQMPEKPEGAEWNAPPVYIDKLKYRNDGKGYRKPGNRQLFVLPVEGGTPRQVTFSGFDHTSPIWSRDGAHLYFSANFHKENEMEPMNSEIYRISISDATINTLTSRYGPDRKPDLSPDGSKIAYLGYDDQKMSYQISRLYIMNSDGSNPELISGNLDRNIENIAWSDDGKGVYAQYTDQGNTRLAHISLAGKVEVITENLGGLTLGRPYNMASFSSSDNARFAYSLSTTDHPSDLGVADMKTAGRITRVNDDLFSFKKLGDVKEIWWNSSYDEREIQGWIVKPPDFDPEKKYPLILEIHGGPHLSYGPVFSFEVQMFAAAGYVVLYANPRGSTGYGEEFAQLIHHNYPNQDYFDLMSGVDAVIEKGYIDAHNLFVTGGSGGGVLTAWIVGKTDRFRAAVAAKPVINWYSTVLYSDIASSVPMYWFPAFPWEDPDHYLERSPITYVENISTPTMLLTGEEDLRTPMADSEQFYAALKMLDVETALVRIPGASHNISARPSNLMAKIAAILGWFEKYRHAPQ